MTDLTLNPIYTIPEAEIFIENGILKIFFSESSVLGNRQSYRILQEALRITRGEKFPVLVDARKVKYWTLRSTNLFLTQHFPKFAEAVAVVIQSHPVARIPAAYVSEFFDSPVSVWYTDKEDEAILRLSDPELLIGVRK